MDGEYIDIEIPLTVEIEEDINLNAEKAKDVVTDNYRVLRNKPTINGTELYDNYDEIDPTVPAWSKEGEPQKLGMAEIYALWQSVFSQ